MQANEIKVGSLYKATDRGRSIIVRVVVEVIDVVTRRKRWEVENVQTLRKQVFRTVSRFLEKVDPFVPTAGTTAKTPTTPPASTTVATAAAPTPGESGERTTRERCNRWIDDGNPTGPTSRHCQLPLNHSGPCAGPALGGSVPPGPFAQRPARPATAGHTLSPEEAARNLLKSRGIVDAQAEVRGCLEAAATPQVQMFWRSVERWIRRLSTDTPITADSSASQDASPTVSPSGTPLSGPPSSPDAAGAPNVNTPPLVVTDLANRETINAICRNLADKWQWPVAEKGDK